MLQVWKSGTGCGLRITRFEIGDNTSAAPSDNGSGTYAEGKVWL
ncbi:MULTISPECIES: hypothetical protein [unclassified Vibrio]